MGRTLFFNGWLKLAGRTVGGGMAMTLTAWDALSDGSHMPGSFSCAVTYDRLAGVAALSGSMLLTEGNPPVSDSLVPTARRPSLSLAGSMAP